MKTRYRWVPTGISATGVSGALIPSDRHICQQFVSFVDDKRFMEASPRDEYSDHVRSSVQTVRAYAVQAQHLPSSQRASAAIKEVARACRDYISVAKPNAEESVLDVGLQALRKRIGTQLLILCERYDLEVDLDLTPYVEPGLVILETWFREEAWEL